MEQQENNSEKQKIVTIPNILSLFRIVLIPIIVWLYCVKENYLWAGYILIFSGITDIVDGFIARKFNMISDLGKVLDPIADKLTQGAMLICLLFRFPLMIIPLVLMIIKEIFMSVTGFLVIKKAGIVPSANWHGKLATCLLYTMMILHIFWYDIPATVSLALIIVCAAMVGVSFFLYGADNVRVLKNKGEGI